MTQSETSVRPISRKTEEYRRGKVAFLSGAREHECPFPIGDGRRTGWYTGWFDSHINRKFADTFAKYNITYP